MAPENNEKSQKKNNAVPITALIFAAGVGAAAFYLVKKSRAAQPEARAADLLDRCDRAATKLDRRLCDEIYVHSA